MNRLSEILSLLEAVKKTGPDAYICRCPAHEDSNPSLSVTEKDGKIVFHCFAGCTFDSICQALDVPQSEMFTEDIRSDEPEQVYVYQDAQGNPVYEVVRMPGKKFFQRQPDGTTSMKGVARVPYNLPSVLALSANDSVLIVEGEKDVEALRRIGHVGTCNSGGAGKWDDGFAQYFTGLNVGIVVDKDEPGRRHGEQVARSLVGHAKSVKVMQAKKGKDLSDHLEAGLGLKDLIEVRKALLPGVVTANEMADRALKAMVAVETEVKLYGNPWGMKEPQFSPGRLYIVGGYTGHGKTILVGQLYRYLSEMGVRACYLTNEMTAMDVTNRLLCHQNFDLKELEQPWTMGSETERARLRNEIESFRDWNSDIIFDTSANYERADEYLKDGAYEFLFVDHLHRIASVRQGEEAAIANEIGGFTNLALNHDIPVVVVGQLRRPHPGFGMVRPTLHDFKGSGAIEQEASMVLSVWKNEPVAQVQTVELAIHKNRYGVSGVSEMLLLNGAGFRFEKGSA